VLQQEHKPLPLPRGGRGQSSGLQTLKIRCRARLSCSHSSKTPAVVGGTRKRKGADHDGVEGFAQDKQKKARAQARNCKHNERKAYCKVPFVRPLMNLRPSI
jgi:hypothetical protein